MQLADLCVIAFSYLLVAAAHRGPFRQDHHHVYRRHQPAPNAVAAHNLAISLLGAVWFAHALLLCGLAAPIAAQTIGEQVFANGFETDQSIQADREELESSSAEALQGLLGTADGSRVQVLITYIGKGRRADSNTFEAPLDGAPPSSTGGDVDECERINLKDSTSLS